MNSSLLGFINSIIGTTQSIVDPNALVTFLALGQSNIDGRNDLIEAPEWINQLNPTISKVKMWDVDSDQFNSFKLGLNTGADWNATTDWAFDMIFYKLYSDYKNKDIYVVKRSMGGTPLFIDVNNVKGTWNVNFDLIPVGIPKLTQELEYRFIDAYTYVANAGKTLDVKAILWYQGGTDVQTVGALVEYKQNLINLINYIRSTIIGVSNIPFLLVTQSEDSLTWSADLFQYQTEIAQELNNIYIVDAKDVGMLADQLHVDSAGSIWIGEQTFQVLKNL